MSIHSYLFDVLPEYFRIWNIYILIKDDLKESMRKKYNSCINVVPISKYYNVGRWYYYTMYSVYDIKIIFLATVNWLFSMNKNCKISCKNYEVFLKKKFLATVYETACINIAWNCNKTFCNIPVVTACTFRHKSVYSIICGRCLLYSFCTYL